MLRRLFLLGDGPEHAYDKACLSPSGGWMAAQVMLYCGTQCCLTTLYSNRFASPASPGVLFMLAEFVMLMRAEFAELFEIRCPGV